MLQITNSSIANKLIYTDEINEVGNGKIMETHSNTKFGGRFFTPETKLAYTKLK